MQPFQINQKLHNLLTNEVAVAYSFAITGDAKEYNHVLPGLIAANRHLEGEQRTWFLCVLENWVNHKTHIIQGGNHTNQEEALKTCNQALDAYQKWELSRILEAFHKGFVWFVRILPSEHNKSYESSLADLNQLKAYAINYLTKNKI